MTTTKTKTKTRPATKPTAKKVTKPAAKKAKPTARALQDKVDTLRIENIHLKKQLTDTSLEASILLSRDRVSTERVVALTLKLEAATSRVEELQREQREQRELVKEPTA